MNSKLKKIHNHIIDIWKDKYELKWIIFTIKIKREVREFFDWLPTILILLSMILFFVLMTTVGISSIMYFIFDTMFELIDLIRK